MDFRKLLKETKEQSAKENLVSETFETALEEAVPVKAAPKKASSKGMDQAAAFLGKDPKKLSTEVKNREPVFEFVVPDEMLSKSRSEMTKEEYKEVWSSSIATVLHDELSETAVIVSEEKSYDHIRSIAAVTYGALYDENNEENLKSVLFADANDESISHATEEFFGEIIDESLRKVAVLANSELADFHRNPGSYQGREAEMAVKKDLQIGSFALSKIFISAKGKEWFKLANKDAARAAFNDVPGLSTKEQFETISLWRAQNQSSKRTFANGKKVDYRESLKEDQVLHEKYESTKELKGLMAEFKNHVVSGGTQAEKRQIGEKIEVIMKKELRGEFTAEESHAINSVFHTNASFGLRSFDQLGYVVKRERSQALNDRVKAKGRGGLSAIDRLKATQKKADPSKKNDLEKSVEAQESVDAEKEVQKTIGMGI